MKSISFPKSYQVAPDCVMDNSFSKLILTRYYLKLEVVMFFLISKILQLAPKPSFRQGLPESRGQGWQSQHLPVDWMPAIPAGMTTGLKHLANQDVFFAYNFQVDSWLLYSLVFVLFSDRLSGVVLRSSPSIGIIIFLRSAILLSIAQ